MKWKRVLYWISGRPLFVFIGHGFRLLMGAVRKIPGYPRYEAFAQRAAPAVFERVRLPARFEERVEPFLEAKKCRGMDPALVVAVWSVAFGLGLYPSTGGLLAATPLIFAMLPLVSSMNPFLGLTSALVFAVADYSAKLLSLLVELLAWISGIAIPGFLRAALDSSGALATASGFVGLLLTLSAILIGTLLAYSTMAFSGLLPGITSRIFRFAAYNLIKKLKPGVASTIAAFLVVLGGGGVLIWILRGYGGLIVATGFAVAALAAAAFQSPEVCSFCGQPRGLLQFCQSCMAPRAPANTPAVNVVGCGQCGAPMPAGAPFCANCAAANDKAWPGDEASQQAALQSRDQQQGILEQWRQTHGLQSGTPWMEQPVEPGSAPSTGPACSSCGNGLIAGAPYCGFCGAATPETEEFMHRHEMARRRRAQGPQGSQGPVAETLEPPPPLFDAANPLAEALSTVGAVIGAGVGLGASYGWMQGPGAVFETGAVDAALNATRGGIGVAPAAGDAGAAASGVEWEPYRSQGTGSLEGMVDWDARHPGHDVTTPYETGGGDLRVTATVFVSPGPPRGPVFATGTSLRPPNSPSTRATGPTTSHGKTLCSLPAKSNVG